MKNTVTAGDYKGKVVNMTMGAKPFILDGGFGFGKKVFINADTVESYEVIDAESQTSATSAVARGYLGAALLGPIGIAAALSAKKKGLHTIAIQFKDGKSSLLEVDNTFFKAITQQLFNINSTPISTAPQQAISQTDAATEIAKYKGLLDSGAITQDEYDAKKKQLLGL